MTQLVENVLFFRQLSFNIILWIHIILRILIGIEAIKMWTANAAVTVQSIPYLKKSIYQYDSLKSSSSRGCLNWSNSGPTN